MYLITCQHKDCPTPNFYVNPKAGKILLSAAPDLSELKFAISSKRESTITRIDELVDSVNKELSSLSAKENQTLKERLREFLQIEEDSTLPTLKKIEDVKDYLVVSCQSKHKNYLLVTDDEQIEENQL